MEKEWHRNTRIETINPKDAVYQTSPLKLNKKKERHFEASLCWCDSNKQKIATDNALYVSHL